MKVKSTLVVSLVIVFMAVVACSKKHEEILTQTPPAPTHGDNKEYFWGLGWQKTTSGYEINLESPQLTDSAINKGIRVEVAIFTDWSVFRQLPLTFSEASLADTINLSYTAVPGRLKVIAKAPFEIDWQSDVRIGY